MINDCTLNAGNISNSVCSLKSYNALKMRMDMFYTDWIEDTLMKANILLLVFDSRLQRLKKELEKEGVLQ